MSRKTAGSFVSRVGETQFSSHLSQVLCCSFEEPLSLSNEEMVSGGTGDS